MIAYADRNNFCHSVVKTLVQHGDFESSARAHWYAILQTDCSIDEEMYSGKQLSYVFAITSKMLSPHTEA